VQSCGAVVDGDMGQPPVSDSGKLLVYEWVTTHYVYVLFFSGDVARLWYPYSLDYRRFLNLY